MSGYSEKEIANAFSATNKLGYPPRYVTVDIGSNKIRACFYGVTQDKQLFEIKLREDLTRFDPALAQGLHIAPHRINEGNLAEAEANLRTISALIKASGIPPENRMIIGTAVLRIIAADLEKKGYKGGKDDPISRLQAAIGFDNPIIIATGKSEAQLIGEAALLDNSFQLGRQQIPIVGGKIPFCTVLAIGGGSTEIVYISPDGKILFTQSFELGMHTLLDIKHQSGGSIEAACAEYMAELYKAGFDKEQSALYLGNGGFRSFRAPLCGPGLNFKIGHEAIANQLDHLAPQNADYYTNSHDPQTRKRAQFMPIIAHILKAVVGEAPINKIVFLETRMVEPMAQRMFLRDTQGLILPPIEAIQRPGGLLIPEPVRHVLGTGQGSRIIRAATL